MQTKQELFVKLALDAWSIYCNRVTKLVTELTDEQLQHEVSTGRNSGVYLVGHLTAVHDAMLPLLSLGEIMHPELENIFIKNPDKSFLEKPSINLIRQYWKEVNETLASAFVKMSADEWFQKHSAISEEDFSREPNRNKLNVLINRTNHLASHYGQMVFLKES